MELAALRYKGQYADVVMLLPDEPGNMGDVLDAAISHYHLGHKQEAGKYLDQLIKIATERSDGFTNVAAALTAMPSTAEAL